MSIKINIYSMAEYIYFIYLLLISINRDVISYFLSAANRVHATAIVVDDFLISINRITDIEKYEWMSIRRAILVCVCVTKCMTNDDFVKPSRAESKHCSKVTLLARTEWQTLHLIDSHTKSLELIHYELRTSHSYNYNPILNHNLQ